MDILLRRPETASEAFAQFFLGTLVLVLALCVLLIVVLCVLLLISKLSDDKRLKAIARLNQSLICLAERKGISIEYDNSYAEACNGDVFRIWALRSDTKTNPWNIRGNVVITLPKVLETNESLPWPLARALAAYELRSTGSLGNLTYEDVSKCATSICEGFLSKKDIKRLNDGFTIWLDKNPPWKLT